MNIKGNYAFVRRARGLKYIAFLTAVLFFATVYMIYSTGHKEPNKHDTEDLDRLVRQMFSVKAKSLQSKALGTKGHNKPNKQDTKDLDRLQLQMLSVKAESLQTKTLGTKDPSFNRILINSYKRSGSTFLGRAVGWSSDSFYWYEPLIDTYIDTYIHADGTHCHYSKQGCIKTAKESFDVEMDSIFEYFEAIYNCDFTRHYRLIKKMIKFRLPESGPSWELFRQCQDPDKSNCLKELVPVCKHATNRVIKLLRLDLTLASRLWAKFPDLKIVQLFRDPRGLMYSHIITKWFPVSENNLKVQEEDTIVSCDRQRRDMQTAKRLLEKFPDRFRIVQYEDFDMYYKMRRLYKFLGMSFTASTRKLLDELSNGGPRASFHPFLFRDNMSWTSVELTNRYCADIYEDLGFVNFETEIDLRNKSIPAVLKLLPYGL